MITGTQIRMARAALDWTVDNLAKASGLSGSAILRAETAAGVPSMKTLSMAALERAFTSAGVVFVDADAAMGPGVRLRHP